jgi:hypothetical protein
MTQAKEKAIQLVNSFDELGRDFTRGVSMKEFSKQCALKTCKQMIDGIEEAFKEYERHKKIKVPNQMFYWDYWSDVQLEIYKL